jgi:hypothetical protein
LIKASAPTANMAGDRSGKSICHNVIHTDAPDILDDSSSVASIALNAGRIKMNKTGVQSRILTKIIPPYE